MTSIFNQARLGLTPAMSHAVSKAFFRRPDRYLRLAKQAYSMENNQYPILQYSPLDRLVVWCCLVSKVQQAYQEKGIPNAVIYATFQDIGRRAAAYWQKHGRPGLSREDVLWFRHIWNVSIFQIGSLQFQLFSMVYLDKEGCGEEYMTFVTGIRQTLPQAAPVINVHIPKGADLSQETVEESFQRAKAFFREYFPGYGARAFLCYSWLLYPPMDALLPENSNIRCFARYFQIIGQVRDPYGSDAVKYLYGKRYPRKSAYPKDTYLQRSALGSFSKLGFACGIAEIT